MSQLNPLLLIILAALLLLGSWFAQPPTQVGEDILFELNNNHIYLKVRIDDSDPLNFLLDTGASVSLLDHAQAVELGYSLDASSDSAQGAGGQNIEVAFIENARLAVGDVEFTTPQVAVISLESLTAFEGRRIDGILGRDFFMKYAVEIDFIEQSITLHDPMRLSAHEHGSEIPLSWWNVLPTTTAEIEIPGIPAITGSFIVDIGASAAVAMTTPFSIEHEFASLLSTIELPPVQELGGESRFDAGRLPIFKIGPYAFSDVVAGFSQNETGTFAEEGIAGIIGAELWQRFDMVIDFSNERIFIEPNNNYAKPIEFDKSGLVLSKAESEIVVTGVISVSPAADSDIEPGDRLIAINGESTQNFKMDEIRDLFKLDGKTYQLKLSRDGVEHEVVLMTRDFI